MTTRKTSSPQSEPARRLHTQLGHRPGLDEMISVDPPTEMAWAPACPHTPQPDNVAIDAWARHVGELVAGGHLGEEEGRWMLAPMVVLSPTPKLLARGGGVWSQDWQVRDDVAARLTAMLSERVTDTSFSSHYRFDLGAGRSFSGWMWKLGQRMIPSIMRDLRRSRATHGSPSTGGDLVDTALSYQHLEPDPTSNLAFDSLEVDLDQVASRLDEIADQKRGRHDPLLVDVHALCLLWHTPTPNRPGTLQRWKLRDRAPGTPGTWVLAAIKQRRAQAMGERGSEAVPQSLVDAFAGWSADDCWDVLGWQTPARRLEAADMLWRYIVGDWPRPNRDTVEEMVRLAREHGAELFPAVQAWPRRARLLVTRWVDAQCVAAHAYSAEPSARRLAEHAASRAALAEDVARLAADNDMSAEQVEAALWEWANRVDAFPHLDVVPAG